MAILFCRILIKKNIERVLSWVFGGIVHHSISPTDSKVRTTLYSITNSTTGIVTLQDFIHRLKSKNHLVQQTKQYHRKVQLSSFYLNGYTIAFLPQTQKYRTTFFNGKLLKVPQRKYYSVANFKWSHIRISYWCSKSVLWECY